MLNRAYLSSESVKLIIQNNNSYTLWIDMDNSSRLIQKGIWNEPFMDAIPYGFVGIR